MHIKDKIIRKLMPSPVKARHIHYSMLFSADDDSSRPSEYLITTAITAISNAQKVLFDDICARMKSPPYYPNIWPGEHYKLLAGLMMTLNPKIVIEIGTATGLSALSMKRYLSREAKIITFDIIDWKNYPNSCLVDGDFNDGRLIQHTDDFTDIAIVSKYRQLLESADIIFIDAEKDGVMEQEFLDNFKSIQFKNKPLVIMDDIHLWNMLKIWRNISLPKLDLTSFEHWSGTGLIEWNI